MNTASIGARRVAVSLWLVLTPAISHGGADPPIEAKRLDHYAVLARDLALSAAWYERVFGFKPVQKWGNAWLVGKGAIRVGIFQAPKCADSIKDLGSTIAIQHVALEIPIAQIEETRARLKALEIKAREEDIGIALSIFIDDRDGNEIELIHYK